MVSVILPSSPGCDRWSLDLTGAPTQSQPKPLGLFIPRKTSQFVEENIIQRNCSEASRTNTDFQIHDSKYSECSLDSVVIQSFKHLLKMYSMQVNAVESGSASGGDPSKDIPMIVAGGLQQYLIKNMKKNVETSEQPRKGHGSNHTTFHDLPDSLQLEIFSHLDAKDLCMISMVCRHWYCISSDNILWQQRLKTDVRQWEVISHTTNPDMYRECQSDWTNKEIYLRCSPEINKLVKQSNINFHHLSNILRTFWPKKTPRVAMFGPGLESSTSLIARKILEDKSGMFKTTGMFPGQFEGLGSGFTMKMGATTFHLMTLYTSSKQEREARPQNQRLQHSRLIARNPHQVDGDAGDGQQGAVQELQYEVRRAIKDLCRTLDAFIFVVDSSQGPESVCSGHAELRAMINDQWVHANTPVVIMSCTPDGDTSLLPCIDVVNLLRLSTLTQPWQVHQCVVNTMTGVSSAIEWVVEQAQRAS